MARDVVMHLSLDEIVVPEGRRPLDREAVLRLAGSIKQIGLQTPITCRSAGSGQFELIAGNHRLEAVRSLGEESIQSVIVRVSDIDARLWEISENLHRAELSADERDEQIAEWVKLMAQKVGEASPTLGGAQPKEAGIRKAAADLGIDVKTVRKAVAISGMEPEVKEASESAGLTRAEMYQVARSDPQQQVSVIADLAEAKATKLDTDIKNRAAEEMAEAIVEHMPHALHGMMKENAWVCAKPLAIALTNLLGGSVMDRGAA